MVKSIIRKRKRRFRQKGARPWLGTRSTTLIANIALIVSIISAGLAYFSFRETRQFNEISVRPWLEMSGPIFRGPKSQSLVVNRGNGAAFLDSIEIKYAGEKSSYEKVHLNFEDLQAKHNATHGTSYACRFRLGLIWEGQMIPKDSAAEFISTEGDCPGFQWKFLRQLEISVAYRSAAGRTYSVGWGVAPEGFKFEPDWRNILEALKARGKAN